MSPRFVRQFGLTERADRLRSRGKPQSPRAANFGLRNPRPDARSSRDDGWPRQFRGTTTETMKRYCQTLTLVDDEGMIEKYVEAHRHVWPEVIAGQREVGILSMQIWRRGRQLFMIMDTVDGFDFARDMARLATLPRQAEWEAYVSQFQGCSADARSDEKWQLMEKIFDESC